MRRADGRRHCRECGRLAEAERRTGVTTSGVLRLRRLADQNVTGWHRYGVTLDGHDVGL
jgi:hypothetical protein